MARIVAEHEATETDSAAVQPQEPQDSSIVDEPESPPEDVSPEQHPPTLRRRTAVLPRPPKRNLDPNSFFEYWARATEKVGPKRVSCRVYRTWPVVDMTMGGRVPKAKKYAEWDDTPDPWTEWRAEMLHRFGSGAYKLYLVDNHSQRELCRTIVENLEDPDYPPVVDPETLVADDPRNRAYIQSLRQKGILIKEEMKRMEQNVSQAAEQLGKIAEKAIEAALRTQDRPESKPQDTPPEEAATKAIEVMGMAAREQAELLKSSFQQILEAQNPKSVLEIIQAILSSIRPTAQEGTVKPTEIVDKVLEAANRMRSEQNAPIDTLDKLAEIAAKLRPQSDSISEVLKLLVERSLKQDGDRQTDVLRTLIEQQNQFYQRMIELQQQQINYLREEIKQAREQNPAQSATKQIRDVVETFVALKDGLGDVIGSPGERQGTNWLDVVKTLAQAAPSFGNLISQLGFAFSLARASQMPTQAQQPAVQQPLELPSASQPQASAPATPTLPPQQAPNPAPQQQVDDPFPGMAQVIIRYLNESRSGEEFADALISWYGEIAYQQIRSMGVDTLFNALAAYPGTAPVVAAAPDRVRLFVEEFVNAEQIWAQQAEEQWSNQDEEDGKPQTGPATMKKKATKVQ